jgi:hypothetical protein
MVKSIFVIGMNRSGTKWLSNMLCNHADIIGVLAPRHFGIIETNMFYVMPRKFGDLSYLDNYIGLIELWSRTDFFKYSEAEKEMFYQLSPRPTNYFELFEILMNDLAKRNKKRFWLQKVPPQTALAIMKHFIDSYYIVIKRNIIDQIKSSVQLIINEGNKPSLIVLIYLYVLSEKIISKVCKRDGVVYLEYEELKKNPTKQLERICETIGIEVESTMLQVSFKKNTSFNSDSERETVFTKRDLWAIGVLSKLLRLFPAFFLQFLFDLVRTKSPSFVLGTFRDIAIGNSYVREVDS